MCSLCTVTIQRPPETTNGNILPRGIWADVCVCCTACHLYWPAPLHTAASTDSRATTREKRGQQEPHTRCLQLTEHNKLTGFTWDYGAMWITFVSMSHRQGSLERRIQYHLQRAVNSTNALSSVASVTPDAAHLVRCNEQFHHYLCVNIWR